MRSQRSIKNDKQVLVERFYSDWKYYSQLHAQGVGGYSFNRKVTDRGDISLLWHLPFNLEPREKGYDNSDVVLTLIHPSNSFKQIVFNIELYVNTVDANQRRFVRDLTCTIIPTLNMTSVVLLSRIIIALNGIVRRNSLPVQICNAVGTIFESVVRGSYEPISPLYKWTEMTNTQEW